LHTGSIPDIQALN